jgi:enterochelin esterase-like enzyme
MFQVLIGCNLTRGHVDPNAGMFGVLHEGSFPNLIRHSPILARDNTECHDRRTEKCNSNCKNSIYTIAGTKLSFRSIGARI